MISVDLALGPGVGQCAPGPRRHTPVLDERTFYLLRACDADFLARAIEAAKARHYMAVAAID
jgi:hypothetical protein